MIILKLAVVIISVQQVLTSYGHGSHTIPIEGYETKLHVLGQHVDIKETPVKVIKITKTVAVKVPVPYPVKVREKVPYAVHVAKPYPVPVPQIIKVPYVTVPQKSHQEGGYDQGSNGEEGSFYGHQGGDTGIGHTYQVQEGYQPSSDVHSVGGYDSGNDESYGHHDSSGGLSYNSPGNSYGYGGDNGGKTAFATENKNYDDAINEYLKNHGASNSNGQSTYHH